MQRNERVQEAAAKSGDLPMSVPQSVPKDGEEQKDGEGLKKADTIKSDGPKNIEEEKKAGDQ